MIDDAVRLTPESEMNLSSWMPWLVTVLALRSQVGGKDEAERVATSVLDWFSRMGVEPSRRMFDFRGEHAVRVRLPVRSVALAPEYRLRHALRVFEAMGLDPERTGSGVAVERGSDRLIYVPNTARWHPEGAGTAYRSEGPRHFAREYAGAGTRYAIRGDTYRARDVLREFGFWWDADAEEWWTNDQEQFERACRNRAVRSEGLVTVDEHTVRMP